MNGNGKPVLNGCEVMPPMESTDAVDRLVRKKAEDGSKAQNRTARDRFGVLNAFVDFTMQSLTRSEIVVWLVLYRDTKDEIAATSQADIARRAGVHRRTVCRALKQLEKLGLVKVVYCGGLKRGTSKYRILPLLKDE